MLFGGVTSAATLGDTWEWDGAAWTQASSFGTQPCNAAAMAFKGDSVALFGGQNSAFASTGITWTWDGQHWTLRQDFAPPPRFGHAMCYDLKRACLVVFGGRDTGALGDTWEHSEG